MQFYTQHVWTSEQKRVTSNELATEMCHYKLVVSELWAYSEIKLKFSLC